MNAIADRIKKGAKALYSEHKPVVLFGAVIAFILLFETFRQGSGTALVCFLAVLGALAGASYVRGGRPGGA